MPATLSRLVSKNIAKPPSGIDQLLQYEVAMGSFAYGVDSDTSDYDVYGWAIPPKDQIFPHLAGHIHGFGPPFKTFETYQQHHMVDPSEKAGAGREYDYTVHSIVKYFNLTMANNPNMVDSLFVPQRCILYMTPIGQMVREKRHLFLTKRSWHTFKGYAYQQLHKLRIKKPGKDSKRHESVEKYGWDVKFGYHVVRLMNEVEQILTEGDIDLERSREQLKAIRRGEWTLEQVERYFTEREMLLEKTYTDSKLRHGPDVTALKKLLLECLEQHFGTLENCVTNVDPATQTLREIEDLINAYNRSQIVVKEEEDSDGDEN